MALKYYGVGGENGGDQAVVTQLSTDTRPSAEFAGAVGLLIETDTDKLFRYDGATWQEIPTGAGASAWGTITGTLANQTDLQTSLDGKSSTTHNHDASYAAISHTHPAVDISNSTALGRSLLTQSLASEDRTSLGLGDSATKNVGTSAGDVAAGNAVSTHEAAADPHTAYQRESEKDAASGYAGLNSTSRVTKGTDATDDLVIDLATKGLILKDTQGTPHYWRLGVTILGLLTTTDLGTSKP